MIEVVQNGKMFDAYVNGNKVATASSEKLARVMAEAECRTITCAQFMKKNRQSVRKGIGF